MKMSFKDKYSVKLKSHWTNADMVTLQRNSKLWAIIVSVMCLILLAAYAWTVISVSESKVKILKDDFVNVEPDKVVSCYYNTPSEDPAPQLLPNNIHPHLCTHINIAFAQVRNKQIYLDDKQVSHIKEITKLKTVNPKLKVLLSVGGAGNNNGFSEMVVDHASRKTFIRSIKYFLRNHSLDGIDLDWEFPALHQYNTEQGKRERQHFSQLLREIRMEFFRERRNYLLTLAVAAPQIIVDVAYDVEQINMYVDFANIMTYDFHYYSQYTPFTGLNSPLYARSSEYFYMSTLNINYTVQMYLGKGLSADRIVVGIPTYGHTFTLVNSNNADIGSPASGFGALGSLGFVNYPDICTFIHKNNVTIKEDPAAKVPYLHQDNEWASYDTPQSVTEKTNYIKQFKLRGAMIYSLNSDDYAGTCAKLSNSVKFPLVQTIKDGLIAG